MADTPIVIGMPVYPGFDLLDIAGPWEMFKWAGYTIELVTEKPGLIPCNPPDQGLPVTLSVTTDFAHASKWDVMWVPGGAPVALNTIRPRPSSNWKGDPVFLEFLVKKSQEVKYVCSVCEGAILLAAAGLLDGYTITTHWAFMPCFKKYYPQVDLAPDYPRSWLDRNRLTGGGISSGLDESLELITLLSGMAKAQAVQQDTQYYPAPQVRSSIPTAKTCPLDEPYAQPKPPAS